MTDEDLDKMAQRLIDRSPKTRVTLLNGLSREDAKAVVDRALAKGYDPAEWRRKQAEVEQGDGIVQDAASSGNAVEFSIETNPDAGVNRN